MFTSVKCVGCSVENSLCENCLHFISWCLYTMQNILLYVQNLIVFYAVLFDSCSQMTIPLWFETCRNFLCCDVTWTFEKELSAFYWSSFKLIIDSAWNKWHKVKLWNIVAWHQVCGWYMHAVIFVLVESKLYKIYQKLHKFNFKHDIMLCLPSYKQTLILCSKVPKNVKICVLHDGVKKS
jgi:hypothetical protein